MFKHVRQLAGGTCPDESDCIPNTWLAKGLYCEWCNSVWFGTLLTAAYWFVGPIVLWFLVPLALSTVAIWMKFQIQQREVDMDYKQMRMRQIRADDVADEVIKELQSLHDSLAVTLPSNDDVVDRMADPR